MYSLITTKTSPYLLILRFSPPDRIIEREREFSIMPRNSILGGGSYRNLFLLAFLSLSLLSHCFPDNSFVISSFSYSRTLLEPYEWRYIKVDLPPWFSSMSLALESDLDLDPESIKKFPINKLPMICLREGSPPLPDAYNTSLSGLVLQPMSNGSFENKQGLQNSELCYPMLKNLTLKLTSDQISPGVWYWGLFNGIGPTRTQSKMINRGLVYSFRGNISVEGCATPTISGQYCNQTVEPLSCADGQNLTESLSDAKLYNQTAENVIFCRNTAENSCHEDSEPKIYSLEVVGITEQLTIMADKVRLDETISSNSTVSGIVLKCYVRYGAIPLATVHDYSANISKEPLVIPSPKVGRWYIAIHFVNLLNDTGSGRDSNLKVCYSLEWLVLQCPGEKAGLNCTWARYTLQTVLRKNPSVPFESYYLPISGKVSSDAANFLLEPLLSNSSSEENSDIAWTYFLLDIPDGAAGGNLHIRLKSEEKIHYEIYARYGGLPSLDSWDYFYVNTTSSSNGSMFFKLYDSDDDMISFYILYIRGGTWSFGLRHQNLSDAAFKIQTTMSISLERCPRRCSSHGTCQTVMDTSGLTLYSYCWCDRNHGGFDCSVEIVSPQGHMWQSIALIASNAAAILPAYWSLRQKAFAEWVIFMSSGISSGLYHACDVGTWCALSFHVLQFMDFWLSFMAVVSTFVYLADIGEVAKRTIHTVVTIVTALMAETGPTRSSNIALVIAIGAAGLLVGWLLEYSTKLRSLCLSTDFHLNILDRWQTIKGWLRNLFKTLVKRFRWGFVLAGFTALAMAAISWTLESTETYWIWHSIWHISIYTSSFLFICSKAKIVESENQRHPEGEYELTRQDSFPRVG
ncbi:hypothetical protein NMG60_11022823 [Bertholletia excelsa]